MGKIDYDKVGKGSQMDVDRKELYLYERLEQAERGGR